MTRGELATVYVTILRSMAVLKHPSLHISIRRALSPGDLATVVAVRRSHWRNASLDAADARAAVFLVEVAGRPVATFRVVSERAVASLRVSALLPPGASYLEIGRLVVLSPHRHSGITAAVALHVLEEADRSGADGVAIDCVDSLVPYYKRVGFRCVARDAALEPEANLMVLDDAGFPTLTAVRALVDAARPR